MTNTISHEHIALMIEGYKAAALWTTNARDAGVQDESPDRSLQDLYRPTDFTRNATHSIRRDCSRFANADAKTLLRGAGSPAPESEHDPAGFWQTVGRLFWLSRNRHGSGFFDASIWNEDDRKILQAAAHSFGESSLHVYRRKVSVYP